LSRCFWQRLFRWCNDCYFLLMLFATIAGGWWWLLNRKWQSSLSVLVLGLILTLA